MVKDCFSRQLEKLKEDILHTMFIYLIYFAMELKDIYAESQFIKIFLFKCIK